MVIRNGDGAKRREMEIKRIKEKRRSRKGEKAINDD